MNQDLQTKSVIIVFLILFFLSGIKLSAQDYFWLSGNPPPQARGKVRPSGMQHYYAFRNNRGQEKLVLWPKSGIPPQSDRYCDSSMPEGVEIHVFGPDRKEMPFNLENSEIGFALTYDFSREGYHNIYLIQREVRNDTLFLNIAKAERLSHKCLKGHKHVAANISPLSFPGQVPFEMIRLRNRAEENFHFIQESGYNLKMESFVKGEKTSDVNYTMITETGWVKKTASGNDGIMKIQIPQDYFSNFRELEKQHTFRYLLVAESTQKDSGTWQGKSFQVVKYSCTMENDYIPAPITYKSYVWSLAVVVFSVLVTSLLIYFYRKRKYRF